MNTKVYLLNVPLENDYKHTLYFTSKEEQKEFFESRIVRQLKYEDFTYQRKDNVIAVHKHYDELIDVNYVMYQNSDTSSKWYYAFVTKLEYENEELTYLHIQTDVIQTWLFDYNIKPSFVEREHVDNDSVGLHTIPENLELGEYICNLIEEDFKSDDLLIYLAYSDYSDGDYSISGNLNGGIYSGMGVYCYNTTTDGVKAINNLLKSYDENDRADAINSIFMGPAWLSGVTIDGENEFIAAVIGPSTSSKMYSWEFSKQTTLNGYTPRNKKLLCYPYNYLMMSNNNGNACVYKYEEFQNNKCEFTINGVICPGMSIRLHPKWYKGQANFYDEGLNAGKYPICCWNSDVYTNWLTQNSVNNALSIGSGILQIGAGIAMGVGTGGLGWAIGGGTVAGGVSTIASTLAQRHQASLVPDQVRGNTNCGDVITSANLNKFIGYKMSIKQEYAKIIDGYFDMFGYQVNMIKTPNKAHRSRYWYTKTININIDGGIPTEDIQEIKKCYDNGITFWRNANEIQNYSLSNGTM